MINLGIIAVELRQLPSTILNESAVHIWAVMGVIEDRDKRLAERAKL